MKSWILLATFLALAYCASTVHSQTASSHYCNKTESVTEPYREYNSCAYKQKKTTCKTIWWRRRCTDSYTCVGQWSNQTRVVTSQYRTCCDGWTGDLCELDDVPTTAAPTAAEDDGGVEEPGATETTEPRSSYYCYKTRSRTAAYREYHSCVYRQASTTCKRSYWGRKKCTTSYKCVGQWYTKYRVAYGQYKECCTGWRGSRCNIPICVPACGSGGVCLSPTEGCYCTNGYTGITCNVGPTTATATTAAATTAAATTAAAKTAAVTAPEEERWEGNTTNIDGLDDSAASEGSGALESSGALEGSGTFEGSGALEGSGTFEGSGAFEGSGTFEGSGALEGSGTFEGSGAFEGSGTFEGSDAYEGSGALEGSSAFEDSGAFEGSEAFEGSGTFEESSAFEGSGAFEDSGSGVVEESGALAGAGAGTVE